MKLTLKNIVQIPDDVLKHYNLRVHDEISDDLFNGNYEFQLQTWGPKGIRVLFASKTKSECEEFRKNALLAEQEYNKTCQYVPDAEYKKKHGDLIGGYQIKGYCYEVTNSTIELKVAHTYKKLTL